MSTREPEDFTSMHTRRLGADGRPALREDFPTYLDRCQTGSGDAVAPTNASALVSPAALARLKADHPTWWSAYVLCDERGLTQRDAAKEIGVSQPTVHERLGKARTMLALSTTGDHPASERRDERGLGPSGSCLQPVR